MTRQTRIPTVDELRRHAHALAAAFDVRLFEDCSCRPEDACAVPGLRVVRVAPITDETTYAVALHELGHLCAPAGYVGTSDGRSLSLVQHEETAAWEWAEYYALMWTAPMQAVATWARKTYDTNARPSATAPTVAPRRINWDDWK